MKAGSTLLALTLLIGTACDAAPIEDDAGTDSGRTPYDAGPLTPPEDLDGFVEWHMAHGGIPGAALAIVRGGEIEWIGTYGYADVDANRPVDEHTLFTMASISKTLAGARAMQLVEAGMLDLDEPVGTYLPYVVQNPAHPTAPVTMRHLLTHTSSLDDQFTVLAGASSEGDPTISMSSFAEGYVTAGGTFYSESNWSSRAPGTSRSYCNAAYGIIGDVIERVGGADFRTQTRTGIFEVMDMDGAGWFLADIDETRLAVPYGFNGRSYRALSQQGLAYYPASTLRVSITGLARFLAAMGNGGAIGTARIMSTDGAAETFRIQFPEVAGYQALVWSDRRVNDHLYVGHSGEAMGVSTQMLWSREGTHGIILLTNSDAYLRDTFGFSEGREAFDAILGRLDQEARTP
jgi:CubicO group peptidase (beta-lactamase class C family)